jgi:DHA2 family multidrug resistance protein
VANAIVLPLGGWASSVFGRKNFFLLCITLFTISSFLCGIAPSLPMLLVFRVLQGFGGGGLQPMAQAIMADSFEPKKRGIAFSVYALVTVLAPSIGPTLGGWITDNYSWRWIFYINIPVGLLAFVLVTRLVDDPPWIKHDRANFFRVDYVGVGFLTLAMAGLQIALDKGEENDWFASNFIRTFAAMFVFSMIALIYWELRKAKNPIMNLRLFKFKNFAICCFLMLLVGGILNAGTVLQPQLLQQLLGYTATNAGMALTGGGLALLVAAPIAGILSDKFPARNIVASAFVFFTIAYWYVSSHINLDMSFGHNSLLRVIQVLPIPFCFIAITNAAYVGLPREASNQVSGLINFARNIGGSILIAISGAQVTNRTLFHEARLQNYMSYANLQYQQQVITLGSFLGNNAGTPQGQYAAQATIYNQMNQQAAVMGYADVYRMLAWLTAGMFFLAFLLSKPKGGEKAPEGAAH